MRAHRKDDFANGLGETSIAQADPAQTVSGFRLPPGLAAGRANSARLGHLDRI
jgi:hypothetical protein